MIEAREFSSPHDMAKHLSKYVTCPSSIVAFTANYFGKRRAVPLADAIKFVQQRRQERQKAKDVAQHKCRDSGAFDHLPFKPAGIGVPRPKREAVVEQPAAKEQVSPVHNAHSPDKIWPNWYRPAERRMFPRELVTAIATDAGFTYAEIVGRARSGPLVAVRAVCCRILRERGMSYPQIGRVLGGRDHSTIINALNKFDYLCERWSMASLYERHRETSDAR